MKKEILNSCIAKTMRCGAGAKLLQMHPKAFSRLKRRYAEHGAAVLEPAKPGPKANCPPVNKTPDWIEDLVVQLAEYNRSLGPVPLAEKLWDEHGVTVDPTTVWRILGPKRRKVRYTAEYKRWVKEPRFYCLDSPWLELQLDGCHPFGRDRKLVCFDAIDDCSRWVDGRLYRRDDAASAIDFVTHLVRTAPFRVQRIRVDNRYGKKFRESCKSLGIEVIVNDPYAPQQNGKIERFHRTVKNECFWRYCGYYDSDELIQMKLTQWLDYYNTRRRHGGYGMNWMTPAQKIAATLFQQLATIQYPEKVTLTVQQYIP